MAELSALDTLQRLRLSGFLDSLIEGHRIGGHFYLTASRGSDTWHMEGNDRESVAADLLALLPPRSTTPEDTQEGGGAGNG